MRSSSREWSGFQGAIDNGTVAKVFTIPSDMRPLKNVFIAVDLCNAQNGRLAIKPSGE